MNVDQHYCEMQHFHNKNFSRMDPQQAHREHWMRTHQAMRPRGEEFQPWEGTDSEESFSPPDTFVDRSGTNYPRSFCSSARMSPLEELEYPLGPSMSGSQEGRSHPYPGQHSPAMAHGPPPLINRATAAAVMSPPVVPKCRQLPCRTFISTGSCPYGDRCVFLHDMSIVSKPVFIKSKRKSKEDLSTDAFFWPTMPMSAVMHQVDNRNQPLITQPYVVPPPSSYSLQNSNNDVAVYSMWEHFLDFCKYDELSIVSVPRKIPLLNSYSTTNTHTGKRRLSVFVRLSQHSSSIF